MQLSPLQIDMLKRSRRADSGANAEAAHQPMPYQRWFSHISLTVSIGATLRCPLGGGQLSHAEQTPGWPRVYLDGRYDRDACRN